MLNPSDEETTLTMTTTTELELEIVCRDVSQTQAIIREFGRPVTASNIYRVSVSEPAMELGMVELSQVVTIVLSFASDVTSHVLAKWIYDRLTASGTRTITIRYAGVEINVRGEDDVKLLIEGDPQQRLTIQLQAPGTHHVNGSP
jgi:hypothetical protein